MKTPAIEKFLSKHDRFCGTRMASGDQSCTCGRDAALGELQVLKDAIRPDTITIRGHVHEVIYRQALAPMQDCLSPLLVVVA